MSRNRFERVPRTGRREMATITVDDAMTGERHGHVVLDPDGDWVHFLPGHSEFWTTYPREQVTRIIWDIPKEGY